MGSTYINRVRLQVRRGDGICVYLFFFLSFSFFNWMFLWPGYLRDFCFHRHDFNSAVEFNTHLIPHIWHSFYFVSTANRNVSKLQVWITVIIVNIKCVLQNCDDVIESMLAWWHSGVQLHCINHCLCLIGFYWNIKCFSSFYSQAVSLIIYCCYYISVQYTYSEAHIAILRLAENDDSFVELRLCLLLLFLQQITSLNYELVGLQADTNVNTLIYHIFSTEACNWEHICKLL